MGADDIDERSGMWIIPSDTVGDMIAYAQQWWPAS
ncbi:hypothetical protein Nocox_37090 [Nonomuraea coxensis DSM 45129]|uniref:Uncharacterized protein n=1 Tax=Nonomuraea coxensis DSM 45129 TaxID=1122611 RepID=A0ABX8UB14_9ACTN|nr:hypothetical protein Nocox_37090 [Nonomuraea coxensis DSM 45129]